MKEEIEKINMLETYELHKKYLKEEDKKFIENLLSILKTFINRVSKVINNTEIMKDVPYKYKKEQIEARVHITLNQILDELFEELEKKASLSFGEESNG